MNDRYKIQANQRINPKLTNLSTNKTLNNFVIRNL